MPDPFVLSGLISRGGLSNWVFFFRDEDLVMIDDGITPTIVAGLEAGIHGRVRTFGSTRSAIRADDEAWLAELTIRAKRVEKVPYDRIRSFRVHHCVSSNELFVETEESRRFGILDRPSTERTIDYLGRRFARKFEITKSKPFAWFETRASFLVR